MGVRNPTVRIVVVNAQRSTTKCRLREQYPGTIRDRRASSLVTSLETPWTICDLEDVVQQRADRAKFDELEPCKLRHVRGIYGQPGDDLHFRKDLAIAAGDELIKACRRTAIARYGSNLGDCDVLLVLAAGWNADGTHHTALDENGQAWRKAEIIAIAELCALNGHPMTAFREKFRDLLLRSREEHAQFVIQPIAEIQALPPPLRSGVDDGNDHLSSVEHRDPCRVGHLEAWARPRGSSPLQTEDGDRANKRRRDSLFLAEMMCIPVEEAETILGATNDLTAALDHPRCKRRLDGPAAFQSSLASCTKVIDVDCEDEVAADVHSLDANLQELVAMGFVREEAQGALSSCSNDVARAVELMLTRQS